MNQIATTTTTARFGWIHWLVLWMVAVPLTGSLAAPPAATTQVKWERYTSKNSLFTVQKPVGWVVQEELDPKANTWSCSLTDPERGWLAVIHHGVSPTGRDANGLANQIVASLLRVHPSLQLAPTFKVRDTGKKKVIVIEGTYADDRKPKRQFRSIISGGDGFMLCERIEAPDGQLDKAAPVLLQTLANLRVANLFTAGPRPPEQLVPQQLASGWAKFSAPPGWQAQDLGKGHCIIADPSQRQLFLVGGAEFITPRYAVRGVRGVLVSPLLSPHEALAFATTQPGLGANFQFKFVKPRADLTQGARGFAGPLRSAAVEDFAYTFNNRKGVPYTGFTCGGCIGDAMNAGWRLWHFSIMAPTDEFEADLPTLKAVMGSYEINGELAGRQMANNMANYYAGLRQLSQQIAMNSEQRRRENLEIMTNNDRSRDYSSYQTTRMIMEDYHYLAGASGYVIANKDGLFTRDGEQIAVVETADGHQHSALGAYGEPATQHMQEVNTKDLFEQVIRPGR